MRARTVVAIVAVAAIGLASYVGIGALRDAVRPFLAASGCTATVDGRTVDLSAEQAENASLIAAIAVARGMPARAVSIALATAYQESKIYNLDGGDRDSVGIFQQRPSQGWGTPAQLQDPGYAANAFYDALARVSGYQQLDITVAAQEVQRSGYPEAYAAHEADARVLASALTGNSPHAFSCALPDDPASASASAQLRASGLTPRADRVRRDVVGVFGDLPLGGFAPGGVSSGHATGSAHYDGRAVDIFVRPVSRSNDVRGWAIAAYLVGQAERLHVQTVIFDARIWTAGSRSGDGWRTYSPDTSGASAATAAILEHRDHVHVDVAG